MLRKRCFLPRLRLRLKRNLSSTTKSYEKYRYLGADSKPSLMLQNHHLDTSIWSEIDTVDSDIFLVSSAKSGSTWMYEVIVRLLYQNIDHGYNSSAELALLPTMSSFRAGGPTKDAKIETIEGINNQLLNPNIKHRIFKLHEPVESMSFNNKCKYIFLSRDFRDIIWSFYNHYRNYADSIMEQINMERYNYNLQNKLPYFDVLNKNGDFTEYEFWKMSVEIGDDFGNPDGSPFWSQLWVIGSWLNIAHQYDNILVIHYNEMKQDLTSVTRQIATFLDIEIDESKLDDLIGNCSFDVMKAEQKKTFGEVGKFWYKKPEQFFNKGVNGRWENVLNQSDIEHYRKLAMRYLTDQQLQWLEHD